MCQPQPLGHFEGKNSHFETDLARHCGKRLCLSQPEIENVFVKSLVHILKAYGMHAQDKIDLADTVYVSGGLQQYLIRTRKKEELSISQPRKGFESDGTTFHDLPVKYFCTLLFSTSI